MASKPETVFRARCQEKLKKLNGYYISIQQVTIVGHPDKLACIWGRFVALEFKKTAKEKPTPMQIYNEKIIKKNGGLHFYVFPENWEEVYAELKKLSEEGEHEY